MTHTTEALTEREKRIIGNAIHKLWAEFATPSGANMHTDDAREIAALQDKLRELGILISPWDR